MKKVKYVHESGLGKVVITNGDDGKAHVDADEGIGSLVNMAIPDAGWASEWNVNPAHTLAREVTALFPAITFEEITEDE